MSNSIYQSGVPFYTMKCPFCSKTIPEESEQCPDCSKSLANICRSCLKEVEEFGYPEYHLCLECSKPPKETEDQSRSTRWTISCPFCHSTIPEDSEYCPECRNSLAKVCQGCYKKVDRFWNSRQKLCLDCALALGNEEPESDDTEAIERIEYHEFLAGGEIGGFKIYE